MVVSLPANLGRFKAIEPFAIEPGTIIWDRFCVIGPVRHEGPHWSAPVVDIQQKLGSPPNRRLELQYLELPQSDQNRLYRALSADTEVQCRVLAVMESGTGIVVLCDPPDGERIKSPVLPNRMIEMATALAGLLMRLHEAGIVGIAITFQNLRWFGGRMRLRGFGHLWAQGDVEQDIQRLIVLIEDASSPHFQHDLRESHPQTARELWERVRRLGPSVGPTISLPAQPPFIGRQRALQDLEAAVGRARIAQAAILAVHGPRGIGKTRLVSELVSRLAGQVHRPVILRGTYNRETGDSQPGLASALEGLVSSERLPPEESSTLAIRIRERLGAFARLLSRFAPLLEPMVGELPDPPEIDLSERYNRHLHTIAEAIRIIGTPERPLVVALDNVEVADSGSLSILQQLVRGDLTHHTVIILNVRGEIPWQLRDPSLTIVELNPLSPDEVSTFLEETLQGTIEGGDAAASTLHEETQGLPLATWSTLQAWLERGVLVRGEAPSGWLYDSERDTSATTQDLFIHRLLRATPDQRWLALLAGIRGGHANRDWLQALVSWNSSRLREALEGLERSGLMLMGDDGSLHFPHDSLRQLLLEASPHDELRKAHGRIAHWLAAQGPSVSCAQLAFHAEHGQAEHLGDLRRLHLDAGTELLQVYDLERATWHFEQALQRARTDDQRREALLGCADSSVLAHEVERAAQYYSELVDLIEEPAAAVRTAAKATYALFVRSSNALAAAIGSKGLRRAGRRLPTSKTGRLWSLVHAVACSLLFESREPVTLRDALCRLYWALIPGFLVRDPLCVAGLTLWGRYYATGLQTADASVSIAFYAAIRGMMGHYRAANSVLIEAEEVATAAGNSWALGVCNHFKGHLVELPSGDYASGQKSLDRAIKCFRQSGDVSIAALSFYFKAAYGYMREPVLANLAWLNESSAMARRQGNDVALLQIEALHLLLEARLDKPRIDVRAHELASRIDASDQAAPPDVMMARTYLALAYLRCGHRPEAEQQILLGQAVFDQLVRCPEICYDFHVAKALVYIARPRLDARDRKTIRKSLAQLRRAARSSPRLRAAWLFARMKYAFALDRPQEAMRHASLLLGGLERHGQKYWAIETHSLLSDLNRAQNTVASLAHDRSARTLSNDLGLPHIGRSLTPGETTLRPLKAGSVCTQPSPVAAEPSVELAIEDMLERLRPTIHRLLSSITFVVVQSEPELKVRCRPVMFETLAVNLICTARDALPAANRIVVTARRVTVEQTQAAALPSAQAGDYVAITTEAAPGPCAPILGGLVGCRRAARDLGGFLLRESTPGEGLRLIAYLPLSCAVPLFPGNPLRALVVHPDALVRRTLVGALTQFDFVCRQAPPESSSSFEVDNSTVVFADASSARMLPNANAHSLVEILSRTERVRMNTHSIRVPFAMGEFMDLLRHISQDSKHTGAQRE